jgi:hypothetical protein
VICLAPRAPGDSVRPRRLSGVIVRPLNFTVRRPCVLCCASGCFPRELWRNTLKMPRRDRNAAGRDKYQQMWDVTADVIRQWDPYHLLSGGAPADEFDGEIASVVAQIPSIHSAADAALAVSRVFSSSFERQAFGVDACTEVGKKLFSALSDRGLIA